MKLKTSFFNPTVFKKNATRFAPAWILYLLCLLMVITVILDGNTDYVRSLNLAAAIRVMAVVNLCYALLNAQLLFGDLYNARLCNALHAMPLRRECWFCTNVISGLVFALVPNTVFSLIMLPVLGTGWPVALWWLLGTTLEYLFFFGTAVFSAFLTGTRFAQVLVCGLINFLSILFYWFAATLFEPLMYGVSVDGTPFFLWSPVVNISSSSHEFVDVVGQQSDISYYNTTVKQIAPGDIWGYAVLCAVIGIVLLALSLVLYRRRKLETAGDFIAVKAVEPVFLVLFTLTVGAGFQMFGQAFGSGMEYPLLALGVVAGFFAGRMLVKRTLRVFQPKAFLGLGGIAAGLVLCLVLVALDAFGIVRHVPDREDVVSISFTNRDYRGAMGINEAEAQEDIDALMDIHRYAIANRRTDYNHYSYSDYSNGVYYTSLFLTYELADGSVLNRHYSIPVESEAGQTLKEYYTAVENVLGFPEDELEKMAGLVDSLYVNNTLYSKETKEYTPYHLFDADTICGLLQAIATDCEAGTMIQDWSYHGEEDETTYHLEFEIAYGPDRYSWLNINVYASCENTISWLEENGFTGMDGIYGSPG